MGKLDTKILEVKVHEEEIDDGNKIEPSYIWDEKWSASNWIRL